MSGGYGGYPGQGYGPPEYEGDPERARPRQPGRGQPRRDGQGYPDQGYPDQGYPDQGYGERGYRDPGYQTRGGHGQPDDGYYYQDPGPQPGSYGGAGGRPQPQRPQPGGGYDQRGEPRRGGYDDREDQGDSSFLPGFGDRPRDHDGGYDHDDRRGPGRPAAAPRGPGPRGSGGNGPGAPRPRKKATRWIPRALVLTVVAVIVVGGLVGGLDIYHKYQARYHPADYAGDGTGNVTVQVMSGDTAFSLAPRLLQLGVIASTRAFTNAAEAVTSTASTNSNGLQAGYYQLHEHMQASLAYAAVTNPKNVVQTTVTIPEGKRAVDVIAIIAAKTKLPLKDFQQVLAHPGDLGLPSYADGKVEGYLFPATYAIVPHESALAILQAMVQRFNVEAQQVNLVAAAQSAGLTPTQLIIEASLAQAEGGSVSDYPKIAEVIHNRLASGMHLQFDSTVLYGLGKYAVSATFKQINTPGPYNTYLNPGLPAGPISNPGDSAIQGVLHPDHGNYLYFLTKPGGKSQFSPTPLTGQ